MPIFEVTVTATVRVPENDFAKAAESAEAIVEGRKGKPDNVTVRDVRATKVEIA